jgi:hypothetical protein
MFQLITTYYKANESEREAENIQCLLNNLSHPLIERVHLFLQSNDFPNIPKNDRLYYIEHGRRPMFSELFEFGNKIENKVIKIVANSDIYFDETLKLAADALDKWDILALTRWDLKEGNSLSFYNNFKSQDVWVFRESIKPKIGGYHIGRHGCDNRLIYEFKSNNHKIANPSLSIKTIHVHQSALRPYFEDPNYEFVPPPFGYLLPVSLDEKLYGIIKHDYLRVRYQYYKSQSNQTLPGIQFTIFNRIWAFVLSKYYAQKLKFMK